MAPHLIKPRPPGTLTERVARLVEVVGIKRAAEICGVTPNTVRRWTDDDYAEGISARNVRLLELAAGVPVVTEYLAHEAGCVLLQLTGLAGAGIGADLAKVGAEIAEVFGRAHEALADDGRIDAAEAGTLIREVDDAIRALATVRGDLKAIVERGPA